MITELLIYLTSRSTPEARAFGHLYESIALVHREKRCSKYWLPHRTMCKEFIISEAIKIPVKKSVLVLGSGPLHEIPLEFLATHFDSVDLVDVVHLKEISKQWQHKKNVRFIEKDITALEKEIYHQKKPLEKMPNAFLDADYSLIISANLLSQLAFHLRSFLVKKARPALSEEDLDRFAYKVTENHFLYLKKFTCPVILITDVETNLLDKNEKLIQAESSYIDFPFPAPRAEWIWNVAPIPEYSKDIAVKMKVAGFVLNI